ncbi:MAG: acyl-CoA thioesterase [Oligoflexales bacterium]
MLDLNAFLKKFPVTKEIAVAWGEQDALGHVNNTVFFRYFESVRIEFFLQAEISLSDKVAPVLAKTDCKFINPIYFPDDIIAGSGVSNIGQDRFNMDYGLFSKTRKQLVALGSAMIVSFNYVDKTKVDLPNNWAKELEKIASTLSG